MSAKHECSCGCGLKMDPEEDGCQDCAALHHNNKFVERPEQPTDMVLCLDCFNWRRAHWHWTDSPTVPDIARAEP